MVVHIWAVKLGGMIAQTVAEEILQLCTNKDIWYEDRILWKAQQHKLFATNDYIFNEISDELVAADPKLTH